MATTANRVDAQTSDEINRRLRLQMEERLAYYETHPDQIEARLTELDREWDIERTLEANASTLAFTGTMLAATVDRRWLALPAIVTGFLFQHAIQGWCPPLPILRRLGFRTAEEINQERYALKALRGDFEAQSGNKLDAVLRAVGIR
ncbi:hypothetical protein BMJ34_20245 [Sinorhizobium medicae]|uniref:DUF2892 domain-containing protein n=2 Tax=Sinorhizobium medicae TaxID=110321 RepID=A0ABX4TCC1_9HYPH|nr:hypothetical protein [Sinorhizobium medicae]MBO1959746.1 hypothetical protein [Sinorhizobium medicae]PLT92960.1 hypothetical protein BMJ33_32445 [Sinorhizobium medicae]PLT95732.1 hypothetical protein BMJ34_20245 [Sinorhizobium medicae]PLU12080.1 hypothetical protein BMJ29_33335 [Sinorhizobium medicae]PLU23124.1 hypothetical protein BMJ30_03140 [Sinorhizobium medicae]